MAFDFRYRFAAVDLDGTLLAPDNTVSSANKAAVKNLLSRGVEVVLVSGRARGQMLHIQHELGLSGAMVSSNGALITDTDGSIMRGVYLDDLTARGLLQFAVDETLTAYAYHVDCVRLVHRNHWSEGDELHVRRLTVKHEIPGPEDLSTIKKVVFSTADSDIAPLLEKLSRLGLAIELDGQSVNVFQTTPTTVEVVAKGVDKAMACQYLIEHHRIAHAATLSFGDGNNDAPMLRWAAKGVAMTRSSALAIAAADFQVPDGRGGDGESFARAVDYLLSESAS